MSKKTGDHTNRSIAEAASDSMAIGSAVHRTKGADQTVRVGSTAISRDAWTDTRPSDVTQA